MTISPETEAQYEASRLRMSKVNSSFRRYMWAGIILGAAIFSTAFFAGALSTTKGDQHGPEIFYFAMSAGVFQILLGLATIVLSWLTAMKNRIPSLILLAVNVVCLLLILLGQNGTFAGANMLFLLIGIALNIWIQTVCNENDALKELPGYPLFSIQADYRAHYEIPADVLARKAQASTHMAEIGRAAAPEAAPAQQIPAAFAPSPDLFSDPAPVKLPPEVKISSAAAQSLGIAEMTPGTAASARKPEALSAPDGISLDSLAVQTPQINEGALPQVNAADMLADMTALPSHAVQKTNPDMLPSPEEVRARLAAMKKAREEHHPEA